MDTKIKYIDDTVKSYSLKASEKLPVCENTC